MKELIIAFGLFLFIEGILYALFPSKMKKIKILFVVLLVVNFYFFANAKNVPESFADLAEKLMPSVVNISTTQTITTNINPFPFEFPPGSPFEEMFKEFTFRR